MWNPDHGKRVCFLLLAALAAAPLLRGADEELSFKHTALRPTGEPGLEIFDDFDGDGIKDILLCDNRTLSLFLTGRKPPQSEPSLIMTAPDDAVLLDVADLDNDGIREIVLLKEDGVFLLKPSLGNDTKEECIIRAESRLIPGRVEELTWADFVRDISGDNEEDIIIPDLGSIGIFTKSGASSGGASRFEKWGEISYRPRASFTSEILSETGCYTETIYLPLILAGGPENDRSVFLFDGDRLRLMKRGEDGVFVELSSVDLLDDEDKDKEGEEEFRARFSVNVFFEDLDKDGKGDLVVCNNREGEVRFYRGVDAGKPEIAGSQAEIAGSPEGRNPDPLICVQGNTFTPFFTDLNSDGRNDLILPSVDKIGLFTILKVLFTSRFDMRFMIFINRGDPLFRLLPDDLRVLSVPLSFTTTSHGISVESVLIQSLRGDFNGDGHNDLLLRGEKKMIHIYFGCEDGTFSKKPDVLFEAELLDSVFQARARTPDLNGDGRADLFLHQKSEDSERWDIYLSQ